MKRKILLPNGRIIQRVPHFRTGLIMNPVCTIRYKARTIRCRRVFCKAHDWEVDAEYYEACGYTAEFWEAVV
jgi:hypothetical protein